MKNRLAAMILVLAVTAGTVAGCGSQTPVQSAQAVTVSADAPAGDSDASALAKELIDRHATPDDVITEAVIEDVIGLLKQKYTYEEDVKEIKYAADFQTYIGDGKGWFKKLFDEAGIRTARVDDASDQEAVLMDRGDLHFANRMLYPYLTYIASNSKVTAFYETRNPQKEIISIFVRADAPYEKFSDLKGKKIAARTSGCQYAALLELADDQGWTFGEDWEFVNTKELKEALLSGEVDAVSSHPRENINSIVLSGEAKIISNAVPDGIYVNNGGSRVVFGPTQFVKDHPNIVRAYSKLYELISAYTLNNKEEAAATVEQVTRVPAANNIYWWENSSQTHYFTELPLDQLKANAQTYADWLLEHDSEFTVALDIASSTAFDEQYFD